MKKGKFIIIISACLMLSLVGFLIINFTLGNGKEVTGLDNNASASTLNPGSIVENNLEEEINGNYTYIPPIFEYDDNNDDGDEPIMTENGPADIPWAPATELDLDPQSITVYVNKEYALPKDYVPEDLTVPDILFDITGFEERKQLRAEASSALEDLFAAARSDGHTLYGVSGYRSYERQKEIFTNNIVIRGKVHTIRYSAVPGTSEHQTGLSIDISSESMKNKLIPTFATCPEGKWVAENAHHFGYIIRYPKNRTDVTGYAYEPWHVRYVGKNLAEYLHNNDLTLDEYYHYAPSEDFDFEEVYAELVNYVPPITPTPTPAPATILVKGTVMEGDIVYPDGMVFKGNILLSEDVLLEDGTLLPMGMVIKGSIVLPADIVLECVVVLPKDIISEEVITLPKGTILESGAMLPDGIILAGNKVLPDGSILEKDIVLPEDTVIEAGTKLPSGAILKNSIVLEVAADDVSGNEDTDGSNPDDSQDDSPEEGIPGEVDQNLNPEDNIGSGPGEEADTDTNRPEDGTDDIGQSNDDGAGNNPEENPENNAGDGDVLDDVSMDAIN